MKHFVIKYVLYLPFFNAFYFVLEIEHLALCSKDSGIKNNVKETLVEAELIESTLLSKSNKITVPVIETSPPAEAASIANDISIDRDNFEMPKEHKDLTENNASKDLTENNAENVEQLDKGNSEVGA